MFTSIKDMSNSSMILSTLQEVGSYFNKACHSSLSIGEATPEAMALSRLSIPDEVFKNAVDVLRPLAYYLQNKAEDLHKKRLGEMLASDTEIVQHLCDGILTIFVKGI